jgi:hypothetical protein
MMNTPEHITSLARHQYIVVGTNELGHHLGGAAAQAHKDFGSLWGRAYGTIGGQSYGIVTLDERMEKMPIINIQQQVFMLQLVAMNNPNIEFLVTRVGCGIANIGIEKIAPLFKDRPDNIRLPKDSIDYNNKVC